MKARSRLIFVYGLLAIVGSFIMIYMLMKEQYEEDQQTAAIQQYYLKADAIQAMEQGDVFMINEDYQNAISSYNVALQMDITNDKIRLQIAKAHKKQCMELGEGCEDALLILNLLIENYSYDVQMIKERMELHTHLGDSTGVKEDRKLLQAIDYDLKFR